jgi:hypothetical protein
MPGYSLPAFFGDNSSIFRAYALDVFESTYDMVLGGGGNPSSDFFS